jgi:hypothetical protein
MAARKCVSNIPLVVTPKTAANSYGEKMKLIPLSQGKFAKVDDEDFEELSKYKWHYQNYGYAIRYGGILMHRQIVSTPLGMDTDHKDLDGLNNCKSNLRICNRHQNKGNMKMLVGNTSGFKGITFCKDMGKWRAKIKTNHRNYHLGYFRSPDEAARAYDDAAVKYFGEFARTNF